MEKSAKDKRTYGKRISVYIPTDLTPIYERFEAIAKEEGISISAAIARAIEAFVAVKDKNLDALRAWFLRNAIDLLRGKHERLGQEAHSVEAVSKEREHIAKLILDMEEEFRANDAPPCRRTRTSDFFISALEELYYQLWRAIERGDWEEARELARQLRAISLSSKPLTNEERLVAEDASCAGLAFLNAERSEEEDLAGSAE